MLTTVEDSHILRTDPRLGLVHLGVLKILYTAGTHLLNLTVARN